MTDVAFGLDLGGTALKFGIVDCAGRVLDADEVPSNAHEGRAGVKRAFRDAIARLRATARAHKHKPRGVGVGVPGTVTGRRGLLVTASPNLLGTRGLAVADFLRAESGLPVVAENDATVACFGESMIGSARGVRNVLMATVGTGLGGGVVVEGHLVRGRYGTGGEIGHAIFQPDGEPCGCGARGCLEQYTATHALRRYYREAGGESEIEVRLIIERARAGEERALRVVGQVGRNLGIGLASIASVIAPEIVVVGGGISVLGPLLLRPVADAFRAHSLEFVHKGVRIVRAKLGNRAGVAGAGLLAFTHAG